MAVDPDQTTTVNGPGLTLSPFWCVGIVEHGQYKSQQRPGYCLGTTFHHGAAKIRQLHRDSIADCLACHISYQFWSLCCSPFHGAEGLDQGAGFIVHGQTFFPHHTRLTDSFQERALEQVSESGTSPPVFLRLCFEA